ncbi:MAG: (d)CMP kinase [Clostridiales bacterium]|jgi:cytidylate kinase|nr:(d)CMP kinase [Clostridiales bacterium]
MESRSIAIDGPSGAGKSTLARLTAKEFGLIYVDTGALYRSVGLFALRRKVASKDEENVALLLPEIDIDIRYDEEGLQRMILNGEDITDEIRLPEVSIYASDVSAMPPVRAFLLSTQREMAQKNDVIMDGRDIGTVVIPNAGLKIFLTAQPEERARRRYKELMEKNVAVTYEEVLRDIEYRDKNDSERSAAPLRAAPDAVFVDTTGKSLDECFRIICALVKEKLDL